MLGGYFRPERSGSDIRSSVMSVCAGKRERERETSLLSSEEIHSQNQTPLQSWHDFHSWLTAGAESIHYPECTAASHLHSSSSSMQHIRFIWMKTRRLSLSLSSRWLWTSLRKHRLVLSSSVDHEDVQHQGQQPNASIIIRQQYIVQNNNTHCFKA